MLTLIGSLCCVGFINPIGGLRCVGFINPIGGLCCVGFINPIGINPIGGCVVLALQTLLVVCVVLAL
jgi:hypothetical protein